jgi:hypothetical protein
VNENSAAECEVCDAVSPGNDQASAKRAKQGGSSRW